jgi:amino acid permease
MKKILLILIAYILVIPVSHAEALEDVNTYRITMLASIGTIVLSVFVYYIIWKSGNTAGAKDKIKRTTVQAAKINPKSVITVRK